MQLKTLNLGILEVSEEDVIRFPQGIPGLPDLKRFVLCDSPDFKPFKFLQSLDSPQISFLLVVPREIIPSYRVDVSDQLREQLGFEAGHTLAVYAIVTPASRIEATTVNLLAPLIINVDRMCGHQVIQEASRYSVKQPLVNAELDPSG